MFRGLNKIIFTVTLLTISSITLGEEIPEIACTFESIDLCYLEGLSLPKTGYRFLPIAEKPNDISFVVITNSSIAGLSRDLCDTFPNLKQISIINVGLEIIDGDALENCNTLRYLQAFNNRISKIPEQLFRFTRNIEEIDFYNNQIKHIGITHFQGLKRLKTLILSSNHINLFPADTLTDTGVLILELQTNDISYLDIETIVDKLPDLQAVNYQNNELSCVRVEQYNKLLTEKNILVLKKADERPRYHDTRIIDEITCLPDDSWAAVQYRVEKEENYQRYKEEMIEKIVQDRVKTFKEEVLVEIQKLILSKKFNS